MWRADWSNGPFKRPGNKFHGWKFPDFARHIIDHPNEDCALDFKAFRSIIADLNEDKRVDGDIERSAADELYYHYLLRYFPDDPQISALETRFSDVSGLGKQTALIFNSDGALVWQETSSDIPPEKIVSGAHETVHRTSGESISTEESAMAQYSSPESYDSGSDIPSLICSLLSASDHDEPTEAYTNGVQDLKGHLNADARYRDIGRRTEQWSLLGRRSSNIESGHKPVPDNPHVPAADRQAQTKETFPFGDNTAGEAETARVRIPRERQSRKALEEHWPRTYRFNAAPNQDVDAQTKEEFDFDRNMAVDTENSDVNQRFDQQYRSKKRSSDETDPMDDSRASKRVKSESEEVIIKIEPMDMDVEVVDLGARFERMRNNCTDTIADIPPRDNESLFVCTLLLVLLFL